ncbi:spinocerebellar ataxia type 10 protein domain-containing protein [Mycena rebaudengoi]|nr:spinocerebellar ataxia type 10 protein domain-containing protein [Mycena rebaudengoi]
MTASAAGFFSQFATACGSFDVNSQDSVASLVTILESIIPTLAQNKIQRERLGENDALWTHLRKPWRDLSRAQLTFWDNDDSDDESDHEEERQWGFRSLCANLAKFTRNLVADVPQNQIKAFENEPDIRRLLHYYTSWSSMEDEEAIFVGRVLAQALSNIVTGNEVLLSKLWNIYMDLPEDQVVLIRLLSCPDPRTLLAAFILILNCVDASRSRIKMLTRTPNGARICISLLDNMVKLYDAENASEGARAFDIGYEIFSRIMAADLVPSLFVRLSMQDEIITPHQTTLLKLVDSYLQSVRTSAIPTTPQGTPLYAKLRPLLAKTFFSLSTYAQNSIRDSLGISTNNPSPSHAADLAPFEPPSSLDVMLPKVSEALVLVTQCIVTVTLESPSESEDGEVRSAVLKQNSQDFFNEARSADQGMVEKLLRLLDLFLPRINFGKAVRAADAGPPTQPSTSSASAAPAQPSAAPQPSGAVDSTGFAYLKRDLVRLLGILCHGCKAVQDRARHCGSIEMVMNLCVVDERNPYLREHAIFTLHNMLKGNPENQAVVEAIKPSGKWDEDGMLRDAPGAVRK